MSNRITQKKLENRVDYINELKGFNNPEYSTIGSYTLDYAYGGVELHRYVNNHGGIHDVFNCGHVSKKELCGRMDAFINGLTS